jgi:hypothetical protein
MLNSDTNLIGTMQEFKESMYGYISDASKDAQGFRTRFDYTTRTAEELMAEAVYWEGQVVITMAEDDIREAGCKVEFEAAIASTIENGAADRNTAIRWMYEGECIAENWNMGTEHWLWNWGISFEDIRAYQIEFRTAFESVNLEGLN